MAGHKVTKGTLSELIVTTELVQEGYDVFWAVSDQGIVDLVALHPVTGNIRLIDVKTMSRRKDGSRIFRVPSKPQKKIGVEIIEVDLNEHFDV